MIMKFAWRMLTEVDKRLLWKFAYNFGWKSMWAVEKFQKRLKNGQFFPAFLFLSVTNRCNLSCQGCWTTGTSTPADLDLNKLDMIVNDCKKKGSYFFGILGGEPLLHEGLFELFEKHPDCYFLLFTNGLLLTDSIAREMRRLGNVSPLISIEGKEQVSDERRGGRGVFNQSMQALDYCRENRLVTGVATSICKSNIDDLATEEFINEVANRGVHYLWYYIYRPVGPKPTPELALSADQIQSLREFIVNVRLKAPMMIVDAYWDHDGNALCPAAVGIGHHINASGDIEPCPPIQFAGENINNGSDLDELFSGSKFLSDFRAIVSQQTRGCVLLDRPDLLEELVCKAEAYDSSGRDSAMAELKSMTQCPSHHQPGKAIPEKSFIYRFAKKHWFFGFGAYG